MSQHFQVAERFMRYVQIDTQSDPTATSFPSTEKQKDLLHLLAEELKAMGLVDAHCDEHGYVYATIPATTDKKVPVLCFCSHADTAPDCSGKDVKPILHKNYQGQDIVLPDDNTQILSKKNHPYLEELIGNDLITASGKTLLGADDKAGVAIIMEFAKHLMEHPEIEHGTIRILFTPDEEVGRGVEKVDIKKLGADYGYTLDGGERGSLEAETFSADAMTFHFKGISAHPGYAKGKMVHAMKVAAEFLSMIPRDEWCPETTTDREGFIHPTAFTGGLEESTVNFIIRDFDTAKLADHEARLIEFANEAIARFPGASFTSSVKEQYRNMWEIVQQTPALIDYAEEAMLAAGVTPRKMLIRGGTDGSRLSFMGLPCPNIFTGEMAIHSKLEYVSVQDMEAAIGTIIELCKIWAKKS
jgi:tripeptide aminopeptidase